MSRAMPTQIPERALLARQLTEQCVCCGLIVPLPEFVREPELCPSCAMELRLGTFREWTRSELIALRAVEPIPVSAKDGGAT